MEEAKREECFGWTCYFKKGKKSEELMYIERDVKKSKLLIYFFFISGIKTASIMGLQIVLHFFSDINRS